MEYIKKEQGAYNLHIIKTKNFKTITVKIHLREPLKKENVTSRNFLNEMLFLSCEAYPSKKELSKACQNLYALTLRYQTRRLGSYLDSSYMMRVLEDRYTEKDNFKKSLELLSSLLFHPNLDNKAFKEEEFNTVYQEMKADLETIKENKHLYATMRLFESMDSDYVSINGLGYLSDLDKITKETLYDYHQNMLLHNIVDIFVLGNVDEEEIVPLIQEIFPFSTFKARRKSVFTKTEPRNKEKIVLESYPAKQSQLAISCTLSNLSTYERNYPFTLYSTILGSGSNSYLFQEVREKASLAYTISCSCNKFDDLLIIEGGITKGKEKEALKIITKQLKRMMKKDLSDEDIEKAKEYFQTAIDDILESPLQIIESYYMVELLGVDDLLTKRKKIEQVTKEEIIKIANKVRLHTVFCLKGEE